MMLVFSCPRCGTELDDSGRLLWCPAEQEEISDAEIEDQWEEVRDG